MFVSHNQCLDYIFDHLRQLAGWASLDKNHRLDDGGEVDILAHTGAEYVGIEIKTVAKMEHMAQLRRYRRGMSSKYPNSRVALFASQFTNIVDVPEGIEVWQFMGSTGCKTTTSGFASHYIEHMALAPYNPKTARYDYQFLGSTELKNPLLKSQFIRP